MISSMLPFHRDSLYPVPFTKTSKANRMAKGVVFFDGQCLVRTDPYASRTPVVFPPVIAVMVIDERR